MSEKKRVVFPKLTERQFQFCQAYVQMGSNATSAAREAGYGTPDRRGSELCKRPDIQETIHLLRAEALKHQTNETTRSGNLKILSDMIEDQSISAMARIRAIELINKMMGWNAPEKQEFQHRSIDDLETTIKKATRLLVEYGFSVSRQTS